MRAFNIVVSVLLSLAALGLIWRLGLDESPTGSLPTRPGVEPGAKTAHRSAWPQISVVQPVGGREVERSVANSPNRQRHGRSASTGPEDPIESLDLTGDLIEIEPRSIGDFLDTDDDVPPQTEPVAIGELLDADDDEVLATDHLEPRIRESGEPLDADAWFDEPPESGAPVYIGNALDADSGDDN